MKTRQQLEVLVLGILDRLGTATPVEDDAIELKASWPSPDQSRQLAGSANRLNGDDLIYIVGVDEKTGTIVTPDAVDPADWWATMLPRFDNVAPELTTHVAVDAGNGQSVVGLAFVTDQAPYLVKNPRGGAPEFEVPLRTATGTHSANRIALLRLLSSRAATPLVTLIDVEASLPTYDDDYGEYEYERERFLFELRLGLFIEPVTTTPVLLPAHEMVAWLSNDEVAEPIEFSYTSGTKPGADVGGPSFGAQARPDGIIATGPGLAVVTFSTYLPRKDWDKACEQRTWRLGLSLTVAGSGRPISISSPLTLEMHDEWEGGDPLHWRYGRARPSAADSMPVDGGLAQPTQNRSYD